MAVMMSHRVSNARSTLTSIETGFCRPNQRCNHGVAHGADFMHDRRIAGDPPMAANVTIARVNSASDIPRELFALERRNKATLGFLPKGAFEDHAHKGWLLVARSPDSAFMGYLLYRLRRRQIIITQLCVGEHARQMGVARALIDFLAAETKDTYEGIRLSCRKDFPATGMWPRLGFVARHEKDAKAEGRKLIVWCLDHNRRDLMTIMEDMGAEGRLSVAIDHNIFLDLHGEGGTRATESQALRFDWLQEYVALHVTSETFNEIARSSRESTERDRLRHQAGRYPLCRNDREEHARLVQVLGSSLPSGETVQDESDRRHLAHAIAGGMDVFVTRDEGILAHADQMEDEHNVSVVRPAKLILRLDELTRTREYQPVRVAGTRYRRQKLDSGQVADRTLLSAFLYGRTGRLAALMQTIREAAVAREDIELVTSPLDEPVSLVISRRTSTSWQMRVLRLSGHRLGPTVLRQQIIELVERAIEHEIPLVEVEEQDLPGPVVEALDEAGFLECQGGWKKLNCRGFFSVDQMRLHVRERIAENSALAAYEPMVERASALTIEWRLRPAKIDAELPCYIVPIRPYWAAKLVDPILANQYLFGASAEIAFSLEGVYYRAARPRVIEAPGRILWYVSSRGGFTNQKEIASCSHLDEVIVGKPKSLFRRFRRLGVYEWRDIFETAKKNLDNDIMVLRFRGTEALQTRVPWSVLQDALVQNGIHTQLNSPQVIPARLFRAIYEGALP